MLNNLLRYFLPNHIGDTKPQKCNLGFNQFNINIMRLLSYIFIIKIYLKKPTPRFLSIRNICCCNVFVLLESLQMAIYR